MRDIIGNAGIVSLEKVVDIFVKAIINKENIAMEEFIDFNNITSSVGATKYNLASRWGGAKNIEFGYYTFADDLDTVFYLYTVEYEVPDDGYCQTLEVAKMKFMNNRWKISDISRIFPLEENKLSALPMIGHLRIEDCPADFAKEIEEAVSKPVFPIVHFAPEHSNAEENVDVPMEEVENHPFAFLQSFIAGIKSMTIQEIEECFGYRWLKSSKNRRDLDLFLASIAEINLVEEKIQGDHAKLYCEVFCQNMSSFLLDEDGAIVLKFELFRLGLQWTISGIKLALQQDIRHRVYDW